MAYKYSYMGEKKKKKPHTHTPSCDPSIRRFVNPNIYKCWYLFMSTQLKRLFKIVVYFFIFDFKQHWFEKSLPFKQRWHVFAKII